MKIVPSDPVLEIWPRIVEAFAHYGKKIRARPGPERRKLIEARILDGYDADELVFAIHGYPWVHNGFDAEFSNGRTSGDYFRVETVFKEHGFEDRVERGERGPWMSREDQVKARQAAGRERLRAAREQG
jgi:hypothetical protein